MKHLLIPIVFILLSCNKTSQLNKDFNCNTTNYTNLEELKDFKKNFTISIPKHWKTNYYYDNAVSSIYSADTTLSLTKATLIDASFITNPINIDENFIAKIKNDNLNMELIELASKSITLHKKPAYYNLAQGIKSSHNYQILNVFVKAKDGFLHVKTEVYGNDKINERLCKAIDLINKITID